MIIYLSNVYDCQHDNKNLKKLNYIHINGTTITEVVAIANLFNEYFNNANIKKRKILV